MRRKKKIKLFVPFSLVEKLNKCLESYPPDFKYKINNFYMIIDTVVRILAYNKNEFANINIKKLSSVTCSIISKYIKYLIKYEILESDNLSIKNKKSYGYKINSFDYNIIEIEPTKSYIKKINNSRTNYSKQEPFIIEMRKKFNNLQFDYVEANKWILKQPYSNKRLFYQIQLEDLKNKNRRFFKRNKTNKRLDSNLTNLKSDLKKFIIGDYVKIDLKNSQPFFLSVLIENIIKINNNNNNIPLCCNFLNFDLCKVLGKRTIQHILKIRKNYNFNKNTNFEKFKLWTKNGTFYNNFMQEFESEYNRTEIKNIMFKVLFSKNNTKNNYTSYIPFKSDKEIFSNVFPFVYEIVKILKKKNNRDLAILLQKIESFVFIDCIAKELVNNNIIPLTIHDEIIVPENDKTKALLIVNKIFNDNFNLIPSFHIKHLSNECKVISDECTISKVNISNYKKPSNLLSIESTLQ